MKQKANTGISKVLRPMGKKKFLATEWHLGDTVLLTNGKYYNVIGLDIQRNSLQLHTEEYKTDFRADCRIICKKVTKK